MILGSKVSFERDHKRMRGEVVEVVAPGSLPVTPNPWKRRYKEVAHPLESYVVKVADLFYWVDAIEFL